MVPRRSASTPRAGFLSCSHPCSNSFNPQRRPSSAQPTRPWQGLPLPTLLPVFSALQPGLAQVRPQTRPAFLLSHRFRSHLSSRRCVRPLPCLPPRPSLRLSAVLFGASSLPPFSLPRAACSALLRRQRSARSIPACLDLLRLTTPRVGGSRLPRCPTSFRQLRERACRTRSRLSCRRRPCLSSNRLHSRPHPRRGLRPGRLRLRPPRVTLCLPRPPPAPFSTCCKQTRHPSRCAPTLSFSPPWLRTSLTRPLPSPPRQPWVRPLPGGIGRRGVR